jgi:hypothetical protein
VPELVAHTTEQLDAIFKVPDHDHERGFGAVQAAQTSPV